MSILTTLIPALLPALGDGLRGVFARITGGRGALPQNVDESIKLLTAETERLKVLAQLDAPTGEIHKWAATARALQRPAIATLILFIYAAALKVGATETVVLTLGDLVGMVTFYLFGDRTYNYAKRGR